MPRRPWGRDRAPGGPRIRCPDPCESPLGELYIWLRTTRGATAIDFSIFWMIPRPCDNRPVACARDRRETEMQSFVGMGAVLDAQSGSCGFRVWAPHAQKVFVVTGAPGAVPNGTGQELQSEGNQYWAGVVPGISAGQAYRFRIENNGSHDRVDAYARDVDSDAANSFFGLVVDRSATWAPFETPRFDDLILYQLHVGSFAGFNDGISATGVGGQGWVATCDQIISKLDYIRGLGFNAIAFLPMGEHPRPANQAHMGYAPTDWFAPETDIGRPANVRRLVDEAHRRGLAVIFDVVYNHASTDINHYWEYDGDTHDGGIYFEGGATPRGGSVMSRHTGSTRCGSSSSTTRGCGSMTTAATVCGSTPLTSFNGRACNISFTACVKTRSGATSCSLPSGMGMIGPIGRT